MDPKRETYRAEHGTTLLAFYAKDTIILAADGRITRIATRKDHGKPPKIVMDDHCKIGVMNGNIIFGWAGSMVHALAAKNKVESL